jgi:DNA-binding GntR family transcriptional regulator
VTIQTKTPVAGTAGSDDPTLYGRIAGDLRQEIADGKHAVGGRLPTEAALCERYGASRYTVREALRELIDLGLIERRQGAGSKVIADKPRTSYINSMRTLSEFSQYAQDTFFDIRDVTMVRLSEDIAPMISAPPRSMWLRISGIRLNAERNDAICHTAVHVHTRFAPLLEDVKGSKGPIYAIIEERSGEVIAEATQEITAKPMPAWCAPELGVKPGSPAMCFVRRYLDESGGIMLASINWHPAERSSYVTTIRRGDWHP